MSGNKFSADNSNRLAIARGKKTIVAAGRFAITPKNKLAYWLNEPPAWRKKSGFGRKIEFQGSWSLNDNHDLQFVLSRNPRQFKPDKIILKGEILSCNRDTLAFEFATEDRYGRKIYQVLELSGKWASDNQNSLIFLVDRSAGPDTLRLQSGWKLNKAQQVTYTYDKTSLKTKTRANKSITFSGFWQLNPDNVLVYILDCGKRSRFEFKAQIESPNLYPQAGKIKYRLGAGIKKPKAAREKLITLYGDWKLNRDLGLVFEMDYGQGKIRALEFGSDINLTPKDKVILSLVGRQRQPLGINVTFSHRFLEKSDAEAFLKFKVLREESAVESGIVIPF